MPFSSILASAKKRIYIVGLFNDSDLDEKRRKFFLLGKLPRGVSVTRGGDHSETISFPSFLKLLRPQSSRTESGLLDETNWFFRIGDRPAAQGDESGTTQNSDYDDPLRQGSGGTLFLGSKDTDGFPGQNIFNSVVSDLKGYRNLLHSLVNDHFEEFANTLAATAFGTWRYPAPLPVGLLQRFVEGIADNSIFSADRGAVGEGDGAELIEGIGVWATTNGVKSTESAAVTLLSSLESWSRARLDTNKHFGQLVKSFQKLSQVVRSRTLLKLLTFWPYQHLLQNARKVWNSVPNRSALPELKHYQPWGNYKGWDFDLATAWINDAPLDSSKPQNRELEKLRRQHEEAHRPALAKPIQRDLERTCQQQVEQHIQGWTWLYRCDNLNSLPATEIKSIQSLLECSDDQSWKKALAVAAAYHKLWDIPGADPARMTNRRRDQAATFARLAVVDAFGALFRVPAFDASYLSGIYIDTFMSVFMGCLIEGRTENRDKLRSVGNVQSEKYQQTWKTDSLKDRASIRNLVSLDSQSAAIEIAGQNHVAQQLAEIEPAVRAFAYGVPALLRRASPKRNGMRFLLRYAPRVVGAGNTGAHADLIRVMREGLETDYLEVVQQAVKEYDLEHKVSEPTVVQSTLVVETAESSSQRKAETPPSVPLHLPAKPSGSGGTTPAGGKASSGKAEDGSPIGLDRPSLIEQVRARLASGTKQKKTPVSSAKAGGSESPPSGATPAKVEGSGTPPVSIRHSISEKDAELIAGLNAERFQQAWDLILQLADAAGASANSQKDLNALLLTELLLVSQNELPQGSDYWLDLQRLIDLVQSGSLNDFLQKHTLSKYSNELGDAKGLTGVFGELERFANQSLQSMRQIVSDLYGMRALLKGLDSESQVVIFNGTAEEFLTEIEEQNLTQTPDDSPKHYLNPAMSGSPGNTELFLPGCIYFSSLAFPVSGGASLPSKAELQSKLANLRLRNDDFDMILPPCIVDLGTLSGDACRIKSVDGSENWWSLDAGNLPNPLTSVPLHYVGPSPWWRRLGPHDNFSTVIPAGYLFLRKLIQDCDGNSQPLASVESGQSVSVSPLTISVGRVIPGAPAYVFNLAEQKATCWSNLTPAFNIHEARASFALTFNFYLAFVHALMSRTPEERKLPLQKTLERLIATEPPGPESRFLHELWQLLAFDNGKANYQFAGASRARQSEIGYLQAGGEWNKLWWSPRMVIQKELGQRELSLPGWFDSNGVEAAGRSSVPVDWWGWLNTLASRY